MTLIFDMKVLFLDIDGVLNSEFWFTWCHYCITHDMKDKILSGETDEEIYVDQMMDERLIANVNRIVESTGCEIVLSSSWRSRHKEENDKLNVHLKRKGLIKEFFDVTPYSRSRIRGRGEEIKEWLNKNCKQLDITSFCIIDDDNDMLDEQREFFVNTDSYIGLTSRDADMAIEILNRI